EAPCLIVDAAEVPLVHVGVIALELLFGAQLHAVIGQLAFAALAVLAGAVFAFVDRRFRPAPDVLAHTPVDLVLRLVALGHSRPRCGRCGTISPENHFSGSCREDRALLLLRPLGPELTGFAAEF